MWDIRWRQTGSRANKVSVTAIAAAATVLTFNVPACAQSQPAGATNSQLRATPVSVVPPLLGEADVDRAVGRLDDVIADVMQRTGVPGVAVAVVYKDQSLYAKGFGVREVGKPERVDADTVFLLASVSKPIASTVIASQVGNKRFDWNDRIRASNPNFALSNPYVTQNATYADMLSHRSGLYTGAGDLLEDLGFDRDTILSRLVQQPLDTFRSSYHYSNFGYTEAGIAAAKAAGTSWEELAEEALFKPLGMSSSSYRHSDFLNRPNKARIHTRIGRGADKKWQAKYDRDADAEAPAGGASASLNDMTRFVRLQLAEGRFGNTQVVDARALSETHKPHMISSPPGDPQARAGFYGLGWNVSYDQQGRVRNGHSGAFNLGTSTNVTMIPAEDLGIVVLTNGMPVGVAESIAETFFDIAQNGRQTVDWLDYIGDVFAQMAAADDARAASGHIPPGAKPARANSAYEGVYQNSYYGSLTVRAVEGGLVMLLGPASKPVTFQLKHIDGDRFVFETIGENAIGLSNTSFKVDPSGRISGVTLDFYDVRGLGTFTR